MVTGRDFPFMMQHLSTPVISPDGFRIAYGVIMRDPKHVGTLWVSSRAGGAATFLADNTSMPSWSPDGASLALVWLKPNGSPTLVVLKVGSNQPPSEIPNVVCSNPGPAWSASGEWIACQSPAGITLVSPHGKTSRTLPRLNAFTVAWSKDSQALYGLRVEGGR